MRSNSIFVWRRGPVVIELIEDTTISVIFSIYEYNIFLRGRRIDERQEV